MRRTTRIAVGTSAAALTIVMGGAPAYAVVEDSYSETEVLDTTIDRPATGPADAGVAGTSVPSTTATVPSRLPFTGGEIATAGILGASALAVGASLVVVARRSRKSA